MDCPVCERAGCRLFMTVERRDYWRCEGCQATFLEPAQRPTAEAELAQYRLHQNDPGDAAYRRFLDRLATPLLARLAPGRRGLDFGCGPGPALAVMLREAGHEVALYDTFFAPDRTVLNARYHFITCTEAAEHFHRPAVEFRQLDTLLEPGGWLALMTGMLDDDTDFSCWHYRRDPTHVIFYHARTMRALAGRHGWHCEFPGPDVVLMHKQSG